MSATTTLPLAIDLGPCTRALAWASRSEPLEPEP